MSRTFVDPSFGATLRAWRNRRGMSLRQLASRTHYGKSHLSDLENGTASPNDQTARLLDEVLETGGELARLVYAVESPAGVDRERLLWVAGHPRRLDRATIDSLALVLAEQRRLEDALGAASLVRVVDAQMATIVRLVTEVPDGPRRRRLVDVAGQWAQFAGWLHATTTDYVGGRRWYMRALEWATEADDSDLASTVLSMRGHMAWVQGAYDRMVALSQAAAWQPVSPGVRAVAIQQEARGLALLGDAEGADRRLDQAETLALRAAENPAGEPDWMYFYDPHFFRLQRGLADRYLGRHDRAIERLTSGLAAVPAEIRASDWIAWYVLQLALARHAVGDKGGAERALCEAMATARATGAVRLACEVTRAARDMGVDLSVDGYRTRNTFR